MDVFYPGADAPGYFLSKNIKFIQKSIDIMAGERYSIITEGQGGKQDDNKGRREIRNEHSKGGQDNEGN
jgi:hypothetical protein